jgi:hypothetical protein
LIVFGVFGWISIFICTLDSRASLFKSIRCVNRCSKIDNRKIKQKLKIFRVADMARSRVERATHTNTAEARYGVRVRSHC